MTRRWRAARSRSSRPISSWSMRSRKISSPALRCSGARNISSGRSSPRGRAGRSIAASASRWRRRRVRGGGGGGGRGWWKYWNEARQIWGGRADAMCGQHHWPVWGAERIDKMIRQQRALYKFAHDQAIRLMNHGSKAAEIAEAIKLPASLEGGWHGRGYYGHIRHNVKAIYQKYLGWYHANPVNLDPVPPVEGGKKYVEYMGGADAILARAAKDFAKGE